MVTRVTQGRVAQVLQSGPHFICVGAQKAGTSWLHWNLLFHPATSMPPEKEVNFFHPPVPPWWQRQVLGRGLRNSGEWYRRYGAWSAAKKKEDHNFPFAWYERYLFATRSPRNYLKLFPKMPGPISGDISPVYATMSEEAIARFACILPHAKIIYLLRDPVDRAWPFVRMFNDLQKQRFDLATAPDADIIELIKMNEEDHGRYYIKLKRWEQHFPGRFNVGFYDQLCEDPERLFMEICNFIGIPPDANFDSARIRQRIYEGPSHPMRPAIRRYLSSELRSEIVALHRKFNNRYTQRWLDSLSDKVDTPQTNG